jgi:hypothetical protein
VFSGFQNTGPWTKFKISVIMNIIHHLQNSLESTRSYSTIANLHTFNSLQHALSPLSLLCLHQSLSANGCETRISLSFRVRWLVPIPQLFSMTVTSGHWRSVPSRLYWLPLASTRFHHFCGLVTISFSTESLPFCWLNCYWSSPAQLFLASVSSRYMVLDIDYILDIYVFRNGASSLKEEGSVFLCRRYVFWFVVSAWVLLYPRCHGA